ncbi:hypothetical protein TEA_001081 [Camellia sinensis var. sinensis]|uniref:Fungal lipase-type domain-containing protein n=1 Tax=Camellia sinensis var. sinensis TaxID=542762 RepID=A0A4S4EWS5_CAMSN|nr:hypothetical protein TEA_001081 [Camellia sinensis var. sinensis]
MKEGAQGGDLDSSLDAGALITDLESELYEIKGHKKMEGRAHLGFMKALGLKKDLDWPKPEEITDVDYLSQHPAYYEIRERLRKQLLEDEEGKTKFIVTGHSLGGALAILFVGLLGYHEDTLLLEKMEGVYTFGQPRVGDDKFKDFMNSTIKKYGVKYLRYVYSNDVVTRVPFDVQIYPYKHFGESYIYFDCFYRGRDYQLIRLKIMLISADWKSRLLGATPIGSLKEACWLL